MENRRVVINMRGGITAIEWSTDEGLEQFAMTPMGIVGLFDSENDDLVQEVIPWMDVTSVKIYELQPDDEQPTTRKLCTECNGSGLTDNGETRCPTCDGWGHTEEKGQE